MALHNPTLEIAARIQYALRLDKYFTLDHARHWCANNKQQALQAVEAATALIDDLRAHKLIPYPTQIARPASAWTAKIGDALWWTFPVLRAPYVGSPLDPGFAVELRTQNGPEPYIAACGHLGGWPGYHTHFTPLPAAPIQPKD